MFAERVLVVWNPPGAFLWSGSALEKGSYLFGTHFSL